MNLTSPFHKLAACIAVTGRVKRHWWSTASACHQRWITVRLSLKSFEALAPQTIYVSATPGNYELEKSGGDVVDQVVRPTGLLDPIIEVRPVATQVDDLLSEIRQRAAINERVLVTTLTKRMAEDLTEYLEEHGERVRYLHSDIDTVERMEIIRDLRLGEFDVLVGDQLTARRSGYAGSVAGGDPRR